jgi:hypothetical protein
MGRAASSLFQVISLMSAASVTACASVSCDCAVPGQATLTAPLPIASYTTAGAACGARAVTVCLPDGGPAGRCTVTTVDVAVHAPGTCTALVLLSDGTSFTADSEAKQSDVSCCPGLYASAFKIRADAGN